MKALKALLAVLLLLLLVGGVPALLIAWSDPLSLLGVNWSTALLRPDDGTILLGVLSTAGWVAWLILAVTLAAEVVSHLSRQRIRVHLPGIDWLQPVVGALVAMALTPVLTSQAEEPAEPAVTHAPLSVEKTPDRAVLPMREAEPPTREYVVQAGDELWGVAERELGDGSKWRSITHCNQSVDIDTPLIPGRTLHLPATGARAVTTAAPSPPRIVVEDNDTLWDLAAEHLDDPQRWPELFDANRAIITDPDEIDIGWSLTLPPSRTESSSSTVTHTATEPAAPAVEPEDPDSPSSFPPSSLEAASPDSSTPPDIEGSTPASATEVPSSDPSFSTGTEVVDSAATATGSPGVRTESAPQTSPSGLMRATALPAQLPDAGEVVQADSFSSSRGLLGPIGAVLAASLVAGVAARRRFQQVHRTVGTRFTTLTPALQRFFSALVHESRTQPVTTSQMGAAAVVVGWNETSDVVVDLEVERCTIICGTAQDSTGMTAAILTSLLCAEWSASVDVVAVQSCDSWNDVLDDPSLSEEDDMGDALARLQRLCAERRLQLGHEELTEVRADADRADVWNPVVFIFCAPLHPAHLDRIHDCLSLGHVGVSVVAVMHDVRSQATLVTSNSTSLIVESETRAQLTNGEPFQPQLLDKPARHAVLSLFAAAMDERTEPAPWWRSEGAVATSNSPHPAMEPIEDGAMTVWSKHPEHPTLLLLGPVDLLGARGAIPSRAVNQCMEYCAWLLTHPGSSPSAMVRDLLVAETTRRSNMSRLRSWLGSDDSGSAYLPDAYSGKISLSPSVTSDWERFQTLLAGGVNTSSTPLLREALSLVRGQPLEGVAFQWPWTSQWSADMSAMITDAAIVLSDRYMTQEKNDDALWAISQGKLAAPEDEALAVRRIQLTARTGGRADVESAVTQLTRAFRATNRDLSTESIQRIQHALHIAVSRTPQR